eukprot:8766-Eustigmatos_ZCMA.PRE.1
MGSFRNRRKRLHNCAFRCHAGLGRECHTAGEACEWLAGSQGPLVSDGRKVRRWSPANVSKAATIFRLTSWSVCASGRRRDWQI